MLRRIWVVLALFALVACSGSDGDPAPSAAPTPSPTPPALSPAYALLGPLPGVVDAAPGRTPLERSAAQLTGPHFSFSLAAVASVTGALPAGVASGLRLATGTTVPDGQQRVLAEITGPAAGAARSGGTGEVAIAVAYGSQTRAVRGGAVALTNGTLAVVVPAGARPVLKVTDEGRTQSLDLLTGRRGADAIAGYYPLRRGEYEQSSSTTTGLRLYGAAVAALTTNERLAAVQLNDLPATLQPWVPGRGWAKAGRAWLVLETSVGYVRTSASLQDPDTVTISAASFAATGPGGRIPLGGGPILIGPGGTDTTP